MCGAISTSSAGCTRSISLASQESNTRLLGGAGGLVYAWGGNEYGQCGVNWGARDVVEPAPCAPSLRVVQVAAGGMHSCVLTNQGEVCS